MFIVIEGLDGVGKTTLAKKLSNEIGATYLSTPSKTFSEIRQKIDDAYAHNQLARQLFYASTVVDIADRVRQLLVEGRPVVVDRYWLSTMVYHNWKTEGKHFELSDVEKVLLVPDLTIYIELSLSERNKRINNRDINSREDQLTLNENAHFNLHSLYLQYLKGPLVGRSEKITSEHDVDSMIKHLKHYVLTPMLLDNEQNN